jgi:hypothetical protein
MFLKAMYISITMFSLFLFPSSSFAQDVFKYPYKAIISCGMGNNDHVNVVACFAKRRNSVDTEMKLSNEGQSGMYKAYNFQESGGQELQDGYHILLTDPFSITIQNSHDLLVLSLKIVDRRTDKIVFNDQASLFGVISVSSSRIGGGTKDQRSSKNAAKSLKDDPSIQISYKCTGTESGNLVDNNGWKFVVDREKKIGKFKEFEVGKAQGEAFDLYIKFENQSPVKTKLLTDKMGIITNPGVFSHFKIDGQNEFWLEFQSDKDGSGFGVFDCVGNSKYVAAFESNDKEKGGGIVIIGRCKTEKTILNLQCK